MSSGEPRVMASVPTKEEMLNRISEHLSRRRDSEVVGKGEGAHMAIPDKKGKSEP